MTKKKKKLGIEVSFVDSESAEGVTGSCIYIKTPKNEILLDVGLHQTNSNYKDFLVNRRTTKEFKPKNLTYIFISHNHIDHIGRLPLMYKRGCNAQVIVSENSMPILRLMELDCAKINERDAEQFSTQYKKSYDPLYGTEDVYRMLDHVKEFPVNQKFFLDDEIAFELIPNAHLLSSVQIKLYITVNNVTKTLLYTGDIGSDKIHNPFVGKFDKVKSSNVVIAECTYGDRMRQKKTTKERKNDLSKLRTIIDKQVKEMNGKVIIPTFAQSRSQTIAYFIWQMYKDESWQPKLYIDSPLAIEIFRWYNKLLPDEEREEFNQLMDWENLNFLETPEESKAVMKSSEPCVVLATSGFCMVGRSRTWLKRYVGDINSTVLFVGYASEDSLAGILKNPKTKSVNIDGKNYSCRCSIYNLKSFSGHTDYDGLMNYYTSINTEKIILHHGSKEAKETFAKNLKEELEKHNKTTKVVCSNKSLKFSL